MGLVPDRNKSFVEDRTILLRSLRLAISTSVKLERSKQFDQSQCFLFFLDSLSVAKYRLGTVVCADL